jgi:hypothetical protein
MVLLSSKDNMSAKSSNQQQNKQIPPSPLFVEKLETTFGRPFSHP